MDYRDNPCEYLASISPDRVKTVKYPRQSWKGRAVCFRLFDRGFTPSDISPRRCRVNRRTLYRYYQDWKILKARLNVAILNSKQELARQHGPERVISIRNIRS